MKRISAPTSSVAMDSSNVLSSSSSSSSSATKRLKNNEGAAKTSNFLEEATIDSRKKIERPSVPSTLTEEEFDIRMQWVDMDNYAGRPLAAHPVPGSVVPGLREGQVPVIRAFGVTEQGYSVLAHIYGVTPYFYCDCPSENFTEEDCANFRSALDAQVKKKLNSYDSRSSCVVAILMTEKTNIMGYQHGEKKKYLQVMLGMPNDCPKARGILQNGFKCPGYQEMSYGTYESNVPFILRYMVDNDIVGGNWLEVPRKHYRIRKNSNKVSRCQIEIDVVYNSIISHSPNLAEWGKLAPLRILSYDIECMGRKGFFPDPTKDPVIQIASFLTVQGESNPRARVVMTLNSCLPIVGATVLSFDNEKDLLLAWTKLVQDCDPDIVTGYNVQNFDFPYLLDRAKTLKIANQFSKLSKLRNTLASIKKKTFSSSAYGTRENKEITMEGRVVMDMILYMYRNHKLSSYSLNAVSSEFLGQQKEDVHHSIISDLQRGTDEDRRRLAVYCLKDAYLPQQLMEKLMVLVNYVEMARVTGVPIPYLFSRGQQIKVLSMLYRKGRELDVIIPVYKKVQAGDQDITYEGATVIEPMKGFYDEPIATLDFASLYPSIMMAHNLCYTTLLMNKADEDKLEEGTDFKRTPCGNSFVCTSKHPGILPTILSELLAARKRAKKDMKTATDPLVKAVMNGRQLALKISANSVYGFTGATVGSLPCLAISSSVTAYGREMINQTKTAVEEMYNVKNGYPADAIVVYGDTDSVMVKFGVKSVKEAMDLGLEAAEKVTKKLFVKPIALEFEKVYYPYLLMNKKRYAGMFWTSPEKFDKMDCKGIETVRRDTCGLVRTVIGTCLQKILVEHSVQAAVDYTKQTISALLQNKVDISLLIITKSLSAKSEEYTNKQPHVELAERMKKRDPGSAPVVGDRVPYVLVKKAKGTPTYEKSEDPIYVLEHNTAIDFEYYLHHQLEKPLLRIFEPIMPNARSLLTGDHTKKRYIATPSAKTGIMAFAVKKQRCLGCKAPISGGSLCLSCEKKRESLYLNQLDAANELEERFSRLWTECQRCQGSLHQDVLCTSRDCPIFYMRKKVQKDLADVEEKLNAYAF